MTRDGSRIAPAQGRDVREGKLPPRLQPHLAPYPFTAAINLHRPAGRTVILAQDAGEGGQIVHRLAHQGDDAVTGLETDEAGIGARRHGKHQHTAGEGIDAVLLVEGGRKLDQLGAGERVGPLNGQTLAFQHTGSGLGRHGQGQLLAIAQHRQAGVLADH